MSKQYNFFFLLFFFFATFNKKNAQNLHMCNFCSKFAADF